MKKILLLFAAVLLIGVFASPIEVNASEEEDVVALLNQSRVANGLGELTINKSLTGAAQIRARESSVVFSHTRPNGQPWYTVSDMTYGENLCDAVGYSQSRPENVVKAWLSSSTHRANVLKGDYTEIGVAYYYADNGDAYIACEFY